MFAQLPRLEDLEDKSFDAFAVERAATGETIDPHPKLRVLMQAAACTRAVIGSC
ncbi:hypothetical protein [Novosphingobium taihuense]|uniref:Uncharacterized protein n=1 Tax=Novosphingobium taihuense TaxID=260085 RepID=A0A7W7AEE5_9SPHN|nr:hypothetical protein [Novosphingobium taihuense]MBB4614760.1 hypothetical protein [Novosphingobium taihuense]TWH78864.1 hypothetical protein IQ25_04097 [Novosphingobium taihuense]